MNASGRTADGWKRADTDWFRDCRWGVVTWDVPIEKDGRIPEAFLGQLRAVGEATGTLPVAPRRKGQMP